MAEIEEQEDKEKSYDYNFVGWNQARTPLVNYNFMLRVELAIDLPLKSVKAFSKEIEYDLIQEGGLNDYVHIRRKANSKPFTFEIERYVGVSYVDVLPLGGNLVLPLMLMVGVEPNQFIPYLCGRTYLFTGCTVIKKTYGDLIADTSGLLVETVTIAYRELLVTDCAFKDYMPVLGANPPSNTATTIQEESQLNSIKSQAQRSVDQINQDVSAMSHAESETTRIEGLLPDSEGNYAQQITEKIGSIEEGAGDMLSVNEALSLNDTIQRETISGNEDSDEAVIAKAQSNCDRIVTTASHIRTEKEAVTAMASQARTAYLKQSADE